MDSYTESIVLGGATWPARVAGPEVAVLAGTISGNPIEVVYEATLGGVVAVSWSYAGDSRPRNPGLIPAALPRMIQPSDGVTATPGLGQWVAERYAVVGDLVAARTERGRQGQARRRRNRATGVAADLLLYAAKQGADAQLVSIAEDLRAALSTAHSEWLDGAVPGGVYLVEVDTADRTAVLSAIEGLPDEIRGLVLDVVVDGSVEVHAVEARAASLLVSRLGLALTVTSP